MLDNTSGTTAISTSSDAEVTALALEPGGDVTQVTIINEGSVAGFFQVNADGATGEWCRLPAGPSAVTNTYNEPLSGISIKVKRVAGGSNLSGIYVSVR